MAHYICTASFVNISVTLKRNPASNWCHMLHSVVMHTSQSLGPLEQQLLELVWQHPHVTGRTVHTLANHEQQHAYTTIMTVLNRLVEKGIIDRNKQGRTYTYTPVHSQRQFIRQTVQTAIQSLVRRFGDEAITAFIAESNKLSQVDRERLLKQLRTRKR